MQLNILRQSLKYFVPSFSQTFFAESGMMLAFLAWLVVKLCSVWLIENVWSCSQPSFYRFLICQQSDGSKVQVNLLQLDRFPEANACDTHYGLVGAQQSTIDSLKFTKSVEFIHSQFLELSFLISLIIDCGVHPCIDSFIGKIVWFKDLVKVARKSESKVSDSGEGVQLLRQRAHIANITLTPFQGWIMAEWTFTKKYIGCHWFPWRKCQIVLLKNFALTLAANL